MCRSRGDRALRCATLVLLLASACSRSPSLDDDARRYVRLAAALGERDPDALDFYVGPAGDIADIRRSPPTLTAIRNDAETLLAEVRRVQTGPAYGPAEEARAAALAADLAAILARVDLLTGTRLPYDAESRAFFGIAPAPADDAALAAIRSSIADAVGGGGRLVDRDAAFAARFTVPPDRLPAVMEAALDECRRATAAHVALPPGERATLEYVHDRPWAAFTRYAGGGRSTIQINADFRFTVDQALQVACHEGYPGHHARNVLAPRTPAERTVQLTFSPESLASEASAMLAIDTAFPPDARVRVERDRLFPIAGLDASEAGRHVTVERLVGDLQIVQADVARRYLDGTLEFARAVAALEEEALVPHADALVKYINEYRSYVTTYTTGRQLLAARLAACAGPSASDAARWRCYVSETIP